LLCEGRPSQLSAATTLPAVLLNRRAGIGAIRAVHAAVARQRAQHGMAVRAVVKPLAGIGGHGFAFGKAALGAGEGGLQGEGAHGGSLRLCLILRDNLYAPKRTKIDPSATTTPRRLP
jgi:hypothetical protein